MSRNIINTILVLISSIAISQLFATDPILKHPKYYSEVWRGGPNYGNYPQELMPDSGLFAWVDLYPNEPVPGYPYHSGIVEGVSDTIEIHVYLRNRNTTDYNISSYQPEIWFTPVIYEINADPKNSHPLPEPSGFGYCFMYWMDCYGKFVTQPSVIEPELGGFFQYHLTYYIWGLPAGYFRLMMDTTEYAPNDFKLLLRQVPAVWITKPQFLADTLNAFTACFWRSIVNGNYIQALSWSDSVLAYNPYSIVGYDIRIAAYASLNDSLAMISAFDSTLAILERYGDPALPDSADFNDFHRMWYNDMINITEYTRWQHITGNRSSHW
jgi:hypothetical protein